MVGPDDRGFWTAPLLDPSTADRLRQAFEDLHVDPDHPRYISVVHEPREQGAAIDRLLREAVEPLVADVLPGYRPFLALFLYKGANGGEEVEFHQDWTYTDERHHRVVTAWVPLVDVDERNGAMQMVPGSHRWAPGLRPSNAVDRDEPTVPHQDAFRARAQTVRLRAGEAVFYDPGIVHGTPPNETPHGRLAFGVHLAPPGAQVVHARRDEQGALDVVAIPEGTYYMDAYRSEQDHLVHLAPWDRAVEAEDFESALAAATRPAAPQHTER
ncbi:MAG: phytanoyl-CoA dioxygenase family protein [Acidimicrobiales bacterium]